MNDKQLTTMWIGILAIVCFSLWVGGELRWGGVTGDQASQGLVLFQVVVTMAAVITVGLVASLADRQSKSDERE